MKKIMIILLSVMLVMSMVGCGKRGAKSYDPDNFMTEEEAAENGNPYQIVKEKVTIKIFVPRGEANPEYSSMKMFQVLSERTNLEFEFIEASVDQYMTLRSVAWEDKNNLPDLFLYNNTYSEIAIYSENGALTPFNDPSYSKDGVEIGSLIDNYMPNYKALVENNFGIEGINAKDILTFKDGIMYSTAAVNDVTRDLTYKYFVNQKWIENINENFITDEASKLPDAADITTIEDYITVLRAFKKYDANLNGDVDDEVPLTANALNWVRNLILASYGYVSNWVEIENDGSSFTFVPSTEAYQKYLETVALMYSEGLLDETTFSTNDTIIAGKGFENRLGSFSSSAPFVVVGDNLDADYVAVGPFNSSYYKGEPLSYGYSKVSPLGAVVPSQTPYAREIARLLDIMYSEFGVQLATFGLEGEDWAWEDENKNAWVKLVPEDYTMTEVEFYRSTLTPHYGLGVALYRNNDFVKKEAEGYNAYLNEICVRYESCLKSPIPEYIHLNAEEYQDESLIGTTLSNFVTEEEFKFVTGVSNIDTDWQTYLDALESYRYKELVQIYNDALLRFNEGE